MKLLYHKLPGVLDEDQSTAFVGIGTLINEKLPLRAKQAKKKLPQLNQKL